MPVPGSELMKSETGNIVDNEMVTVARAIRSLRESGNFLPGVFPLTAFCRNSDGTGAGLSGTEAAGR